MASSFGATESVAVIEALAPCSHVTHIAIIIAAAFALLHVLAAAFRIESTHVFVADVVSLTLDNPRWHQPSRLDAFSAASMSSSSGSVNRWTRFESAALIGGCAGTLPPLSESDGHSASHSGHRAVSSPCLLYTSDAADERSSVDLG